jgi:hypothetical protein
MIRRSHRRAVQDFLQDVTDRLQRLLCSFCAQVVHPRILDPFPSLAQPRGSAFQHRQQLSEQDSTQLHEILSRIIDRKGWQSLSDDNKRKSIARFRREIEESRPARIARLAKNQ